MGNSYTVTTKCPHCGKRIDVEKKKNGAPVHQAKVVAVMRHIKTDCPITAKQEC